MKHVVVGLITTEEGGTKKYLLISSKKDFGEFTGAYYPPGGHLEEGENEQAALVRELKEELGLKVTPIRKIAETGADVPNQTTHWWECEAGDDSMHVSDELMDACYVSAEEIKTMKLWPATRRFFDEHVFNVSSEPR